MKITPLDLVSKVISLWIVLFSIGYVPLAFGQVSRTTTDTVKSKIVGPLDFKGTVEELGKSIKGAIVTVYSDTDGSGANLTEIKKIVTPGSGEFAMKLEINKFYVVRVEKAGYTMKGIDVDTDVRLARPEHTKVPAFEFKVDMVKDVDGLAFKKSVANVFYQIKRNTFDYELDYSKEELEEEERLLREQEEKRKLAELAAQKKFELEEAAKLLREQDDASMEEKIKAAITVGNENRIKTLETLTEIFPLNDTLRDRKAEAIYTELQKERKKDGKTNAEINYKSLFAAAMAVELSTNEQAAKDQEQKLNVLRDVQLDAARKKEAAMAVQQQALELEMREKIAAANVKDEERRRAEEKEKTDKIYFAIFNSNGVKSVAVANITKTYAKGDPYAEQKAEAIYAEYEKARLSGTTLAKIDFSQLFNAAEIAEQQAIKEDIAKSDSKENAKTDAYLKKEAELKASQEKQKADAIIQALSTSPKDEASQLAVFIESFPKSDAFRTQKAEAMFEEYKVQQQTIKKTGKLNTPLDFGAMFAAAETAEIQAKQELKEQTFKQKTIEQEKLEKQREEVRVEKIKLGEQAAKDARQIHVAKMNEAKNQKERDLANAIEVGNGDRAKTIQEITNTFSKGTEKPTLKAEAMYDAYLEESKRIRNSGQSGAKIDFSVLFQAAEQAELIALQREFEQKQAVEQEKLVAYEDSRLEKTKEVAQEKAKQATTELAIAEKQYESTAEKIEQERIARIKAEQESRQAYDKQLAMEQAKREALEKDKQEQELAKLEEERRSRLSAADSEKERIAALKLAEQRKIEAAAKAQADKELAQAEKERSLALIAQQKAEEGERKEKARREAADLAAQLEAEKVRKASEFAASQAAAKAESDRVKEEQRLKAEAERTRIAAEQAAAKEAAERSKEESRLLVEAEKARIAAEQAAASLALEQAKEEQRKKDEAEKIRVANEQAKAKAETDRIREEERLKIEAERVQLAQQQAVMKAEAEAKRLSELAAAEEVRKKEEEAKRIATAEKQKRDEDIARLLGLAKLSATKNDHSSAVQSYDQVLALEPNNKEAQAGLRTSKEQLVEIAKAQEAQRILDAKYDDLISKGEKELSSGNVSDARKSLAAAAELNPNDRKAQDLLSVVKTKEIEIAAAEEEKRQLERRYVLLMQEGSQAMGANNIAVAKLRYTEASVLKPEETEPKRRLDQIADAEKQLAIVAEEKRQKEEEAQRKFQEQQRADAERKSAAEKARNEAIIQADAAKQDTKKVNESAEIERAKRFDQIKENIEKLNMNAEDQRKAFLSELSKLYPQGVTEEVVNGKNYTILRNVINESGIVTVYEKRTWDWGGVFWFKNSDIAITESLYKLELSKYGK
jgi:hypothetical protein